MLTFVGRRQELEICSLWIYLDINVLDFLYLLENQQTTSSLQGQTQQVQ